MKLNTPAAVVTLCSVLCLAVSALADEPLWNTELANDNVSVGTNEWVIHPTAEPRKPQYFADVLNTIYGNGKSERLRHIALGKLFARDDLQADVVSYLERQRLFYQR